MYAASCCFLSGSSLFAKVLIKGFPEYKGLSDNKPYLGIRARKPVLGVHCCMNNKGGKPACASAQSHECLCYSLFGKYII